MRTTIALDPDVEAEVDRIRRVDGLGLSEAVNTLARRGMLQHTGRRPVELPTFDLGITIDVTNIAEVLDALDDE